MMTTDLLQLAGLFGFLIAIAGQRCARPLVVVMVAMIGLCRGQLGLVFLGMLLPATKFDL